MYFNLEEDMKNKLFLLPVSLLLLNPAFADQNAAPTSAALQQEGSAVEIVDAGTPSNQDVAATSTPTPSVAEQQLPPQTNYGKKAPPPSTDKKTPSHKPSRGGKPKSSTTQTTTPSQ